MSPPGQPAPSPARWWPPKAVTLLARRHQDALTDPGQAATPGLLRKAQPPAAKPQRTRHLDRRRILGDVLLALVLATDCAITAIAAPHKALHGSGVLLLPALPPWLALAAGCAAGCLTLVRRRYPLGVALVAVLLNGVGFGGAVLLPVALYTLATSGTSPRRLAAVVATAVLGGARTAPIVLAPSALVRGVLPQMLFWRDNILVILLWHLGLPIVLPVLLGLYVATRRRLIVSLREKADQARQEQRLLAEQTQIAREMHDGVAHYLSVIVMQADGAGCIWDADPAQARKALETIAVVGRHALDDIRQLLGMVDLRSQKESYRPQPGVEQLAELVEQMRTTGLPVSFTVEGRAVPMRQSVTLAAYRLLQEALVNVSKHAAGTQTAVLLRYQPQALEVVVENARPHPPPAPVASGGQAGLVGIRERVSLCGGTFCAGATPEGGFRVTATLPYQVGSP